MLSPDILTRNIAALTRAQGGCPSLGRLTDTMRVTLSGADLQAEVRTSGDVWEVIDTPLHPATEPCWLDDAGISGSRQVMVVGAGLGYVLDRAEHIAGLQKILAIEPDPGLATVLLSRRDLRAWFDDGRLRLLTGPDYRGATDVARFLDGLNDIPIVPHPLRARWDADAVARATSVAGGIAQNARSNGNARRKFAGPYLLQTLTNIPAIAREADTQLLDQAFAGVPAVVVGAGPSLDENLPELLAVQDRGVIIAADTALGPLLSAGIRPHIAVGVDSSALNAQHLTSPSGSHSVMLAAEGSLHPSVFQQYAGRIFSFRVAEHEPWPWLRRIGLARGELRAWGSVLTSAFDLARRMGCNPIVFAGADLAFTGMRPYCRGTIYDAMWQEWVNKGCSLELLMEDYFSRQPEVRCNDIHGRDTRSAPQLMSFRDWLVEQIAATAGTTTFINGTGAGILHGRGLRQSTLHDALVGCPPLPAIRETLRRRHGASRSSGAERRRLKTALAQGRASLKNLPVDRWIEFTGSTITPEDISAALR